MPHAKVEAPPIDAAGNPDALTAAVNKLIDRTPEEKLADRTEALTYLRKGRPLPAGKTFDEVVRGTWPGDETDEQNNEALERLS